MKQSMSSLKLLLILAGFLSSNACVTIVKTGYQTDKKSIAIDISDHNLQYQYSSADVFKGPLNNQLDEFDKAFIQNLNKNILASGYSYNMRGEIQSHKLKDCLIDFKTEPYQPYVYNNDTLYTRDLTATFICTYTSDSIRLFHSKASFPIAFQTMPILQIQNKDSASALGWYFSNKYAYRETPLSYAHTDIIARKLATNTCTKLDTFANVAYRRKYPERYHEIIETKEASELLKTLGKVVGISLIVLLYLITPTIE